MDRRIRDILIPGLPPVATSRASNLDFQSFHSRSQLYSFADMRRERHGLYAHAQQLFIIHVIHDNNIRCRGK